MSIAVKPTLKIENEKSGTDTNFGLKGYEEPRKINEIIGRQTGESNINNHRLEMAIKECFRLSTGLGRDIWNDKRKVFIEQTIRTYHLFTEIAERLQNNPNL